MRVFISITVASLLLAGACFGQSDAYAAETRVLDFKQWGLLAI